MQTIYRPNRHQGEKFTILTKRGSFDRLQWLHCQFNFAESLKPLKAEH